ncbi:MAG: tetratricopeptide repeat protein, partial [Thermostichus sp. DG02_5_bins_236]
MKEIEEKLLQGIQAQQAGELRHAEAIYLEILAQFPEQADALHLLGTVAQALGELELAASLIESAIEQNPQVALYRHNLGVVYESLGQLENALSCYQEALKLNPNASTSASQASKILVNWRRGAEAIPLLHSLLEHDAEHSGIPLAELHLYLAIAYRDQGEHSVALNHLEQALILDPALEQARWFYHLYLPAVYQDEQELESFRSRFIKHLDILIQETNLETQEQRKIALSASGLGTNHHLQYQGFNDIELQNRYASFVQRIVTVCYPEWSCPVISYARQKRDPIRVGFLSDSMRACSYSRLSLGWLKYLNTSQIDSDRQFKIFAYHVDPKTDFMTDLYRQHADTFRHIPTGLEAVVTQVLQDQLDILVYLEIG